MCQSLVRIISFLVMSSKVNVSPQPFLMHHEAVSEMVPQQLVFLWNVWLREVPGIQSTDLQLLLRNTEAECVVLYHSLQDVIGLGRFLLPGLHQGLLLTLVIATSIHQDHQACTKTAKNDMVQSDTKPIKFWYHFSSKTEKSGCLLPYWPHACWCTDQTT